RARGGRAGDRRGVDRRSQRRVNRLRTAHGARRAVHLAHRDRAADARTGRMPAVRAGIAGRETRIAAGGHINTNDTKDTKDTKDTEVRLVLYVRAEQTRGKTRPVRFGPRKPR